MHALNSGEIWYATVTSKKDVRFFGKSIIEKYALEIRHYFCVFSNFQT